ncbi:MAG: PilZ domain-containing protein [Planctomycetota bacterium]
MDLGTVQPARSLCCPQENGTVMEPHSPADRLNVVVGSHTQGLPDELNRLLSKSLTTSFNLVAADSLDGLVDGCSGAHPQVALLAFSRSRDNEAAIHRLAPLDPRLATIAVVEDGDVEATLRAVRAGARAVIERKALQTSRIADAIRDARYPRELLPAADSNGASVSFDAPAGTVSGRVRDVTDTRVWMVTDDLLAPELEVGDRGSIRLRGATKDLRAATDGTILSISNEDLGFAIELNISESRTSDRLALQRVANSERRKSPRIPVKNAALGMLVSRFDDSRPDRSKRGSQGSGHTATLKDVSNEGLSFVVRRRGAEDLRRARSIKLELSDPNGRDVVEMVGANRRRTLDERGVCIGVEIVEVDGLPLAAQRASLQRLVRHAMGALLREGC